MRRNNQENRGNRQDQQSFENAHRLHELSHGRNSRNGNYPIDSHYNTYYGAYGNEEYDNQGGYNNNDRYQNMNPQNRYRPGGATYSGPDYYGRSQGWTSRNNYRSEEQRYNDYQDHIHDMYHSEEPVMGNMYQEDYESRDRYNRPHNRHNEREWISNRQWMQQTQNRNRSNDQYNHPDAMRNHNYDRSHYPNPDYFNYSGGNR